MRRLRDTPLNLTRRGASRPPRRRFRAVLAVLFAAAAGLLVLERLGHPVVRDVRWRMSEWLTPVLAAAAEPLGPVRWARRRLAALAAASDDVEALRADNRRLAAAASRTALLERRVTQLEALARVVPEHAIPFVSARVVATSSGIFVRSVTIDAGRDADVSSGYPVVGGDGLVGRIVEAGATSARVLLLTDLASRVPVLVGRAGARAILSGDNSGEPRLEFVAAGATLADGDEVVTSGVGGVYPRGLRVGRVVAAGRAPRVALYSILDDLEVVSVLRHQTPLGDLDNDAGPAAAAGGGNAARTLAGVRPPDPTGPAP